MNGSQPGSQLQFLSIPGDLVVGAPCSLDLLTPYILKEQQDWFEDEIHFVRQFTRPGMRLIDIGASYGVYALTMARFTGRGGQVWAFEPDPSTCRYLRSSIEQNRLEHLTLIEAALSDRVGHMTLFTGQHTELNSFTRSPDRHPSQERTAVRTLDECARAFSWTDIDFIKLDAEGEEVRILDGGKEFLASQSPLVMFELKHGAVENLGLVEAFDHLGYAIYRYIPGLHMLAPVDASQPFDGYQLNLFACKPDRARTIEARGILTMTPPSSPTGASTDDSLWRVPLESTPCARRWFADWVPRREQAMLPGWMSYRQALSSYVRAHWRPDESPGARYGALCDSWAALGDALEQHVNLSRLQMLARVAWEAGYRSSAVDALERIISLTRAHARWEPEEPFWPVAHRFDTIEVTGAAVMWCLATALAQHQKLRAFSSYFTGKTSLPTLQFIERLGLHDEEVTRRIDLIKSRHRVGVDASER